MIHANNRIHYDPMVLFGFLRITLPHYHHVNLSGGIDLLKIIYCQVHSVSSVCLRLSQFSQLFFMQYMGLCVFSLPISLMLIVLMLVLYLIIIKWEEWHICY